ncbi:MAG: 3-oxoacyl-ACP reductase family protein [Candidatus Woesearchaeota archaeon]
MELGLKDKVVLVTGSSRGIGKATALEFAREGAKIVVNYKTSKDKAEEVLKEINAIGAKAIAVKADVSKKKDVDMLIGKAIEKFGSIDILVNNAGIAGSKTFDELSLTDWQSTFDVNLFGLFLCSQAAARFMKKQGFGRIINITSVRGVPEFGRTIDYAASKAAVISFTKMLAKELAPTINVNAVGPGFIETEMARLWSPEFTKFAKSQHYLKRFGKPEEVAAAVVFLASKRADFITGHVLMVDGGFCLK